MINFVVIYSKKDEAGMNIAEALKNYFLPQMPIIEFSKESINLENIDEQEEQLKNAEFIIFATKHQSKTGGKTLSLHAPGNWRNADYGGKPSKVCPTNSLALKFLFQKLNENAIAVQSEYKITLECTHHGPLINKPCCFIELGSNIEQWQDKKTAEIIAKTIADFQNFEEWKKQEKGKVIPTFLIGGGHYAPSGNKIMLETNYAVGHIFPKYHLPINQSMIEEALNKTQEHIEEILVDWKGLGIYKKETIELLDKLRLKYKRI